MWQTYKTKYEQKYCPKCKINHPSSLIMISTPSSFPFLGNKSYLFSKSWASLVTQLVKNLPAMQETWVQSLGWEDPQEKGRAAHSSILAWRTL